MTANGLIPNASAVIYGTNLERFEAVRPLTYLVWIYGRPLRFHRVPDRGFDHLDNPNCVAQCVDTGRQLISGFEQIEDSTLGFSCGRSWRAISSPEVRAESSGKVV
jgi:hypothetical protein